MLRPLKKTIAAVLACSSLLTIVQTESFAAPASPKTSASFNSGVALYTQKNYRQAAQMFEKAMLENPANADAVYYCALCHQQSNNLPRAKQLYEYISQRFPTSRVAPLAQTALGQLGGGGASLAPNTSSAGSYSSSPLSSSSSAQDDLAGVPELVRVQFEKHGNDVMVPVQVNGRTVQFCLDTGAGAVAIGMNHLKEWGISSAQAKNTFDIGGVGDGKAKGWMQRLDLKLGPIYRRDFPCMIQDNMPTSPLLGQTFLKQFNVNIDDNTRTVILAKKGGLAARDVAHKSYDAKEVPFVRSGGGHMWVDAKINGKTLKMIFDTGAEATAISMADWQKLGFSVPEDARQGTSRGVLGDAVHYQFTVDSIKLGGLEQNSQPVFIIENSKAPPLLGMSFYGKYKFVVDVNRNVIIFNEQ